MIKTAQLHRFGDCVVMYLSKGETVYMTPKDAIRLAKHLTACSKDIKSNRFVNGTFPTVEMTLEDTGHNGCNFKIERITE